MASPHTVEVCVKHSASEKKVEQHLRQAALATLLHQDVPSGRVLTVVLSNDDHLHHLNLQYAGKDSATDVLAFPTQASANSHYLGDIIISVEKAEMQARSAGCDQLDELRLLTVHGTLHLLGHEHGTTQTKTRMWLAQAEILAQLET